ncbi:Hypothetical protein PHPALM_17888, partial [Phytophthora palmivora]
MFAIKARHQAAFIVLAIMLQSVFVDSSQHQKLLVLVSGGAVAVAVIHAIFMGMCCAAWESVLLFLYIVMTCSKTLVLFVLRGCTTKFPNWSLRFELLHAMIHACTETYGERMVILKHAQWIRAQSDLLGSVLGWFACRQHNRSLEAVHFNGLEHVWIRNNQPRQNGEKRLVVLYIHGGGFAVLSPRFYTSLGAALASSIEKELENCGSDFKVDLLLGNYRKAPEYCFPTQPEDTVTLYENFLLTHEGLSPSQIIIAGDSAGGGLVMSTLLRLRGSKPEHLPVAGMLIAPAVDLTGDEPDAPGCFVSRGMCKAFTKAYHPNFADSSKWEDASSAHCDLHGLPPILLQIGRLDYVYQHAARLASKANADGVTNWQVDVHDDMPHVFSIFPTFVLPYAQIGIQKLAVFAAKTFVKSETRNTRAAKSAENFQINMSKRESKHDGDDSGKDESDQDISDSGSEEDEDSSDEDLSESDEDQKTKASGATASDGVKTTGAERTLMNQPFDEAVDLSESESSIMSEDPNSPKKQAGGGRTLKNQPFDEALELSESVQDIESPKKTIAPATEKPPSMSSAGAKSNAPTSTPLGNEMKNNPFDEQVDLSDSGDSIDTN